MAFAAREAAREVRGMSGRLRRIAMARIACRGPVLVTRQAGGRGRFPGEVLTVTALTDREVPTAPLDFALVVRRESSRMHALRRTVRTTGLLALDGTTGDQRYDDEPVHRW
jgi:hypothetical protein